MKLKDVTPRTVYYAIGHADGDYGKPDSKGPNWKGVRPGIVLDNALWYLERYDDGNTNTVYVPHKGRKAADRWKSYVQGAVWESGVPVLVPSSHPRYLHELTADTRWLVVWIPQDYIVCEWAEKEAQYLADDERIAKMREDARIDEAARNELRNKASLFLNEVQCPQPLTTFYHDMSLNLGYKNGGLQWLMDFSAEMKDSLLAARRMEQWKAQRASMLSVLENLDDDALADRLDVFNFLIEHDDLLDEMREYIKDFMYEQEP